MQKVETPSRSTQPNLRRTLGTADGVAILVGITIGVGIYSTPQLIAGYLDSFYLIFALWALVGLGALLGSLVYAELGTRLPRTGGEYAYIHFCFGRHAGFLFGWSQLLIIRTSPGAALSLVAADYLGYFFPMADTMKVWVALGIIFVLGAFNYVGIQAAAAFQKASTLLKIVGVFGFSMGGLFLVWTTAMPEVSLVAPAPSQAGPISAFAAAMMLIVFSHTGFDRVGYVAGEMKNPRRVIPASMAIGMTLILVAYLSLNWIYHSTLGIDGVRSSTIVASDTAIRLVGPEGAALVALLVILSSISSTNGTVMAASRVYYAMARDGIFFKVLDYVHPRFRTPSRAVIVHCLWAAAILLLRQRFETIIAGMAFAVLIFYALATFGLFKLRRQKVGEREAYRVPLYPLLPAVYLIGVLLLILLRLVFEFEKSLIDLAFILSGLPFAWWWCRDKKSKAAR